MYKRATGITWHTGSCVLAALLCTPFPAHAGTSLKTENWIALLVLVTIFFAALLMTIWHQLQKRRLEHDALELAYKTMEKEVSHNTQKLRSLNNTLYGEIAEHKATEAKLRQAQDYLHSIINSMPSILIGVTPEGIITHWNTSAEVAIGKRENDVIGKYLHNVYPNLQVDLAMIREAIADKTPRFKESCKQLHNGETRYYDIAVYPLMPNTENSDLLAEATIQVDDVTMRVMMENMMVQNEKMMSLGELAAGMAHEINNPLGAILQGIQNIKRRTSLELAKNQLAAEKSGTSMEAIEKYLEERQIRKFLDNIQDAGERSARIVSNMLEFSRRSSHQSEVSLNKLAKHCLELAENNFKIRYGNAKIKIRIKTRFDSSLPKVRCSPAEIQQVLLNLLRNASQSIASKFTDEPNSVEIPTITVTTEFHQDRALVRIRDNGIGIPDETRKHIFEPFFTTKESGRGTGLGLSISYFIITEHHGGSIEVQSPPDGGAEFIISLPCRAAGIAQTASGTSMSAKDIGQQNIH